MKLSDMKVNEIQGLLKTEGFSLSESDREALSNDQRAGVRKIYQQFCRQEFLFDREMLRLEKMSFYEKDARQKGFMVIAGVDEAGRGPLAGPVVAAAVILPEGARIQNVDDSKKLSPVKRDQLFEDIKEYAISWSIGLADVAEIDELNILQAALMAMGRALQGLSRRPDFVLVDAVRVPSCKTPQLPIVKGDGKSLSIAAASIMAKVTRDRLMEELDREFPQYGFARHKGYGTREHLEAITKHGLCPLHRKTFTKNIETGCLDSPKPKIIQNMLNF